MPFEKIPGLPGKVYIPVCQPDALNKNRCRDCFSCQFCSENRCQVCLKGTGDEPLCVERPDKCN